MKTNGVLENIKICRSARAYTGRQVSEKDLQAILKVIAFTPSGTHLGIWYFITIQDADKLAELSERAKDVSAKNDEPKLRERGCSKACCCYYRAPTLVTASDEPTQWWAGMDCACVIESMFSAIYSLGIESYWVDQLDMTCNDPEVCEFISSLGVPEDYKVCGCVALGHTDPKISLRERMARAGTVTVIR